MCILIMPEVLTMAGVRSGDSFYPVIKVAMIISVVLAAAVMSYLYIFCDDAYSALYLIPESYSGYSHSDDISFVYGVKCFEGRKTANTMKSYLGDSILKVDSFELKDRESTEMEELILIPGDMVFPSKVSLVLENGGNSENVHFWLKG